MDKPKISDGQIKVVGFVLSGKICTLPFSY